MNQESDSELDFSKVINENARAIAEFESDEFDEAGQQDLQDRRALRRVAGLSTELQDISDAEYRQLRLEKVVLVGVWTEGSAQDADNSLKELAALAETAGSEVLDGLIQRRDKPDPATYIGSGKVKEVRESVVANNADAVICDGELSPAQLRTLEQKVKVKVIDATSAGGCTKVILFPEIDATRLLIKTAESVPTFSSITTSLILTPVGVVFEVNVPALILPVRITVVFCFPSCPN